MRDFLFSLQKLDRRIIFLGMALSIFIPLLFPFPLPFKVSKEVQAAYDQVEALPKGAPVLVSADFDPSSMPELWPFFQANLHHIFANDLKPVFVTLLPTAPPLIWPEIKKTAKIYNKEYGVDYVFLGYKDGKELVIKNIGQNIPQQFPQDYRGNPINSLEMMQGIKQAKDFPMLVAISAGFPGINEYVLQIQGLYKLPMIGACTAVSGPDYIPFFKSKQLLGLSMGIPGSAKYERLVQAKDTVKEFSGTGAKSLNVLSLSHLYIIFLIVIGNLAYFMTRDMEEPDGSR